MEDLSTFGKRMAYAMRRRFIKPWDLAHRLELKTTVQISQWTNDKRVPDPKRGSQIAQELGVSVDWLYNGVGGNEFTADVSRETSRVEESVPRYGLDRRRLSEILKRERALEWLLDFQRDLRAGAVRDDTVEMAIDVVTSEKTLTLFAGATDGLFTEQQVIDGMERSAESIRRRLAEQALYAPPHRRAQLESADTPAQRPSAAKKDRPA